MDSLLHIFLGIFTVSVIGLTIVLIRRMLSMHYEKKLQLKLALKKLDQTEEENTEKEKPKKEGKKKKTEKSKVNSEEKSIEEENINISSKEMGTLLSRSEIFLSQNELPEAEKIVIQILSYDENNEKALSLLGEIYLANNAHAKSSLVYEKLIDLSPRAPLYHTNYALSLLHEKDFEKSIFHYEKAAEFDPQNPERYNNLGQVYFTVKNYEAALECFFKSIKIKPRNIEYIYLVADTYRCANRFSEAKVWYGKVLEISPYDTDAKKEIERLEAIGF